MKIAVRSTPSTSQKRSAEPSGPRSGCGATGMTKKRPTASRSEKMIVRPQVKPPISCGSSSSASCALAEIARARKPIFSDSARATTPRITGSRRIRLRLAQETIGSDRDLDLALGGPAGNRPDGDPPHHHALENRLAPDGRVADRDRPAIGHAFGLGDAGTRPVGPRVGLRASTGALGGTAAEPLDAAACVNQLLLARVKGVALRADLHVKLRLRGAGIELVPARAVDVREDVIGVDICLHRIQV